MAGVEKPLLQILKNIATDHDYDNEKIDLKPLSTGGANYTSKLFTITLSTPGKEDLKLFSKVATLGEKVREMVTQSVFETEILFYTKILPKFREFEDMYKIPMKERLICPEYYGGSTEYLKEILVLEDLSAKGYQTMNRFDCFDWKYACSCVNALARFHALSVAFEKCDPIGYSDIIDVLKFEFPADQDYLNKGVLTAINATDEKYKTRVEKFLQDDLRKQTFLKFFQPERRRFVLGHGDFRPSNILHKVDEDGNLNVVPVDYQVIRRGNPVCDLMFFLICGSDEQFRADHMHQFFDHYYETFSNALQRLRIDAQEIYPEKEYRDDVQQMLSSGLSLGVYGLPFITVDTEKAPKPEDSIDMDDMELEVGDRFRNRFNGLVRTYVKLGML